ncbi:hypothetical protein HK096_008768 [Nowakowskiella sp. JEL0078]|nr:hypothetical protein HK096_008768 [Nowakowskiella sp. JEL0078]
MKSGQLAGQQAKLAILIEENDASLDLLSFESTATGNKDKRSTLELRIALLDVLQSLNQELPENSISESNSSLKFSAFKVPQLPLPPTPVSDNPILLLPRQSSLYKKKTLSSESPKSKTFSNRTTEPDADDYLWTGPDEDGEVPALEEKEVPAWKSEADDWFETESQWDFNAVPNNRHLLKRETDYNFFFKSKDNNGTSSPKSPTSSNSIESNLRFQERDIQTPSSDVTGLPGHQQSPLLSTISIPQRHMSLIKPMKKITPPNTPSLVISKLHPGSEIVSHRTYQTDSSNLTNISSSQIPGASKAIQLENQNRKQITEAPMLPTVSELLSSQNPHRNTFITSSATPFSFPLASLLRSNLPLAFFLAMLLTEQSAEFLFFILDVHNFELTEFKPTSDPTMEQTARRIYKTYIIKTSLFEIPVTDAARQNTYESLVLLLQLVQAKRNGDDELDDLNLYELDRRFIFTQPIVEVLSVLDKAYDRFLKGRFYKEMQIAIAEDEPDEWIRKVFVQVLDSYYGGMVKGKSGAPMRERVRAFLKSRFGISLMFGPNHVLDLLVSSASGVESMA